MARYSRVALYNKAHNASHNQLNRTKPIAFRRNIVEIPEAKNQTDLSEKVHQDLNKTEPIFTPYVEVGEAKNAKTPAPKKRAVKSASKAKKVATGSKKQSLSKAKKSTAKASDKKMAKKGAAKKAKPAKKAMVKKAASKKMASKKMMTKKANHKVSAKPSTKKRSMKSK